MKRLLKLPYLPVVLAPFILFLPIILSGRALFWGVPSLQFIPWKVYALESLKQGILPLWNSLNGMGAPLIANYQLAFFYPPNWPLFLVYFLGGVSWMAWAQTIVAALHLVWAGVGMIKLLQKLELSEASQAISGVSFALSGYLVSRTGFFSLVWAASWLPWILYFACKFVIPIKNDELVHSARTELNGKAPLNIEESFSSRIMFCFPLSVCLTFQLLAGHAQVTYYSLLFLTAWVCFSGYLQNGLKGIIKGLGYEMLAVIFAFLLSAIQLLPTAEYLTQSQRSTFVNYDTAMTYSFWPWRFLTLLAPNLFGSPGTGDYWGYANYWEDAVYIGLLPIILAFTVFIKALKKNKTSVWQHRSLVIFLWFSVIISFFLALGKNTPIFPFLYRYIPTFNMFQAPTRFTVIGEFSLALLAGIGLENITEPAGKGLYWLRLSVMGGAAITIGAFLTWHFLPDIKSTFVFAAALTGLWGVASGFLVLNFPGNGKGIKLWGYFAIILVTLDLLVANWKQNPSIDSAFYADTTDQIAQLKSILSNHRTYLSLSDEYKLKYERFLKFNSFSLKEDWIDIRSVNLANLNILENISTVNNFDPLLPARYEKWMIYIDDLNDQEEIAWLQMMDVGVIEKIDSSPEMGIIFTLLNGATRYRWFPCAIHVGSETEAWEKLKQNMVLNNNESVVWEDGSSGSDQDCNPANIEYTVLLDSSQKIVIQIQTPQDGYFVLSETWYPGWSATLDGKSTAIVKANYLFQGVKLQSGIHTLEFSYNPLSFRIGSFISVIFILSMILFAAFGLRYKSRFES